MASLIPLRCECVDHSPMDAAAIPGGGNSDPHASLDQQDEALRALAMSYTAERGICVEVELPPISPAEPQRNVNPAWYGLCLSDDVLLEVVMLNLSIQGFCLEAVLDVDLCDTGTDT